MPNRVDTLIWEAEVDPPLRAEIVDAGLALADERGLAAMTIRRVAESVGRPPMSLYTHVPSKDGLVALMFERISARMLVPEPVPDDGHELMRRIATRAFDAYMAHPWILHAFGDRPPPGPSQLRRAEQSALAMAKIGIREQDRWRAAGMVHEWVMGHALHMVTLREDRALTPAGSSAAFADGLALILEAIRARFASSR